MIQTRAKPLGISVQLANSHEDWVKALQGDYFAVLAQYPTTSGRIDDLRADVETAHSKQAAFIVAADLLALTLLTPPGEWGADICIGTTPVSYTHLDVYKRQAMGYVIAAFATVGTRINAIVRGNVVAMEVAAMPFVPTRYFRG